MSHQSPNTELASSPSSYPAAMADQTLLTWLEGELNKRLDRCASDAERVRVLTEQVASWQRRHERFVATDGDSEQPHPLFGMPTLTDMILIVCMLQQRLIETEQRMGTEQ